MRLHRHSSLLLAVILCFLFLASGAGLLVWNQTKETRQNSAAAANANNEQTAQTAVLKQAGQFDRAGEYSNEATALTTYLKSNPPKKYQYQPLMALGVLAYNQRNFPQAISYYQQAETVNGGLQETDAASLATAYQAEGNNTMAIQYYQKAIQLTKVEPGVGNSIADYKATIKYLGGTP